MRIPLQRELYLAYLDPKEERSPIIIVSKEEFNKGKYVVAVPTTTKNLKKRWNRRNCVRFKNGSFGLDKDCVAQCEGITVIEKEFISLEEGPIGELDGEKWRLLLHAIGYVFGAIYEPDWEY